MKNVVVNTFFDSDVLRFFLLITHTSSIQEFVLSIIFSPFSLPNFLTNIAIPFGSWKTLLEDRKNKTIHKVVTKILVVRIIAPTIYAPCIKARIPAMIDNKPAAKTSVTISIIAIQVDFDGGTPFLCK